jgi:YhcH/YjgK/YiaL family protein
MVFDRITNARLYSNLGPRLKMALDALAAGDIPKKAAGRYDLDGDNVYAIVQDYTTRTRAEGKWEAHRKYIDVQFTAKGVELMGYANLNDLKITETYQEKDDYLLAEGEGSFITLGEGMFTILYPQDAHMPGQAVASGPAPVKKVVVKVKVD